MPRRTIYYVIFGTLLWGALAEYEVKLQDILQSNTTRNKFSNLLKNLIKMNEQRVSVLQKLTKLEDYGVLSEVLRTGDTKTRKEKQKKMILFLLTKNQSDSRRRNMGMQVASSIPSLNKSKGTVQTPEIRAKNHPQKNHALNEDDVRYVPLKNNNFELVFGDNIYPKKPRERNRMKIDDRIHIFTTVAPNDLIEELYHNPKPLSLMKVELLSNNKPHEISQEKVEEVLSSKVPKIAKVTPKIERESKTFKQKDRFKIVSDGRHPSASQENLENENHNNYYHPIANDQDNQYPKIDISTENDHNIKFLQKHRSDGDDQSHIKSKVNKDMSNKTDHDNQYPNIASGNSNKNYHGIKHLKMTRHNSNESDPGIKNPKITKDNSNENDHGNKQSILAPIMLNEKGHNNNYPKIEKDMFYMDDYNSKPPKTAAETHDGEQYVNDVEMSMEGHGNTNLHAISDKNNQENTKSNPIEFGQPESKPLSRKNFQKCLNEKALKLCCKSCFSTYKNVCRRLKCSSKSRKIAKSECKKSCKKTFTYHGSSEED